jgi:hypothetical protein
MYEYNTIIDGVETLHITTKNPIVNITDEKDINEFTKVLLTDENNNNIELNILKFYLSKWFPHDKISTFINMLNNNFVITGSSILKMIHTFNSESSDLDLAINEDVDIEDLLELLHDTGFELFKSYYSNIPDDSEYINHVSLNTYIKEIHQFYKDDNKIDIIILNTNPWNYIKSFDLKIVMNYFDGNGFYLLHPENVINKKENLKHIPIDFRHYVRIEKYLYRGFKISIFDIDMTKLILERYDEFYYIDNIELIKSKIASLVFENVIYNNRKRKEFKENLLKYAIVESERYMDPDSKYIKYYFNNYFNNNFNNVKPDKYNIIYLTYNDELKIYNL